MSFDLRCVLLLGLLSIPHSLAQSRNNGTNTNSAPLATNGSTATRAPIASNSSTDPIHSCNSQWQSYLYNRKFAYKTETEAIFTLPSTTTEELGFQTCSSYCGDICYAANKTVTSTTVVTGTIPIYSYSLTSRLTYTDPAPNCTIPATACRQLWSEYTSAQSSWNSKPGTISGGWLKPSPTTPGCTVGCTRTQCQFGGGDKGLIPTPGVVERLWNSLEVYYFPQTKNVSRDMCAAAPTAVPQNPPTGPVTIYHPTTTEGFVVQNGKTFYKGNVYVSIAQMEVRDNCGWSTVMEDVAFPVASSDVFSERPVFGPSSLYAVDWADFQDPVPWSAYIGAQSRTFSALPPAFITDHDNYCKTAICDDKVVYPESFHPWIVLPRVVQNVDPAFADCQYQDELVFFDPPIALTGAANFLTTALPRPTNAPAVPGSSPTALPVQTRPGQPAASDPASNEPAPGHSGPADPSSPNDPSDPSSPNDPSDPSSPNDPSDPSSPNNPPSNNPSDPHDPTSNNPSPGRPNPAAPAATPHITAGPSLIPVAPNNQGLIFHSTTAIAPSGSAVIQGTTFHLESGVLTMVSPSGTSTLGVAGAGQNAVGTVVALGGGGYFTIAEEGGSVVFDVETTVRNGDPAQTVNGVVVSVGEDGVWMMSGGTMSLVAWTDIETSGTSASASDARTGAGALTWLEGSKTVQSKSASTATASKTASGVEDGNEAGTSSSEGKPGAAATVRAQWNIGILLLVVCAIEGFL